MPAVGVRELKAHASEIVRAVDEERAHYIVTRRGRPVAVISPLMTPEPAAEGEGGWEEFFRLADEVAENWKGAETVQEVMDDARRPY